MKTRILLLAAFISLFIFPGISQCLVLHHEGEQLEPNAVIDVQGNAYNLETVVELDVENTCGNDIDVMVQRYEEYMVPGTSSAFCWLVCFLPEVSLSPWPLTIPANSINTEDFSGHYYPDSITGVSTISYVFFDQNNPDDSVMVTVNYDAQLVGVDENHVNSNTVNLYPVPAKDQVTISIDDSYENLDFQILDITGSLVKSVENVNNGSSIRLSGLSEGLYLYRTFSKGSLVQTGRFVINR